MFFELNNTGDTIRETNIRMDSDFYEADFSSMAFMAYTFGKAYASTTDLKAPEALTMMKTIYASMVAGYDSMKVLDVMPWEEPDCDKRALGYMEKAVEEAAAGVSTITKEHIPEPGKAESNKMDVDEFIGMFRDKEEKERAKSMGFIDPRTYKRNDSLLFVPENPFGKDGSDHEDK